MATRTLNSQVDTDLLALADTLREQGDTEAAIELYARAAAATEEPSGELCLKLARCLEQTGAVDEAFTWVARVVDGSAGFLDWASAASLLDRLVARKRPETKRSARVALASSYTASQLASLLKLAALRQGIDLVVHEGLYGQFQQDILDPRSSLYQFEPDFVLIAPHEGALELPDLSDDPRDTVRRELDRWQALWERIRRQSAARIVQHNFALRPEVPLGHLASRLPGSRYVMAQLVNLELGLAGGEAVSIVDCERLASLFGKGRWFDDRYWHAAKQAVSLDALPLLARHTAAVMGAALGLTRKCIVLDLDNTLWGGVIGEDGLAGIRLGNGPVGEAYVAFQEHLLALKAKGIVLAVVSKNNEDEAKAPFLSHPDMRLRLDDIALFIANWNSKSANLELVASTLNIGLDALVFVDDNPVERQTVRTALPDVEVVSLPRDPSGYVRALADCLSLETAALTAEDANRTSQYRARAEIAEIEASTGGIEEFLRALAMRASVKPFDELHLPRVAQLISKTNQFNLTTPRYSPDHLRQLIADPSCLHLYLRLRDRFADHGLVSVIIGRHDGIAVEIDTWLMSCRVMGRTVERALLAHLSRRASELGCSVIRGKYVPSGKNAVVERLYDEFGFVLVDDTEGTTTWEYDLGSLGPVTSEYLEECDELEFDSRAA